VPSLNVNGSLAAGAFAAIGASICCVSPLVLLLMGIGGAWVANLAALEPMRPFFIGATLLFVALAFGRLYLVPQVCDPGMPYADPRTVSRQRLMFWIVVVVLASLLAVPWMAPIFY
jgi:mercuric ion transport protein